MRKTVTAVILTLCLFAALAAANTAGEQPGITSAVLPLTAPSPETSAAVVPPRPASDALAVSQATDEPAAASTSPEQPQLPDDIEERLEAIFAGHAQFSGTVLIAHGGDILLNKSYGMADEAKGIDNTADTKYLVASVTKQFTATAILQLYEKGLLEINDKLSEYLPDFTGSDDMTLINLLTQTSGITDYLNDAPILISSVPYEKISAEYLVELLKTKPLKFEPGAKYSYSNSNYLILGYIVEKVSGMSYGDYLSENIFEPLGMNNTGLFDAAHPPENMATGYKNGDTPIYYDIKDDEDDYAKSAAGGFGAGGLYSTAGDLYIWDQALAGDKLLTKSDIEMMMRPSVPVPGGVPECAYGYGWVIENDPEVGTVVRHTGVLSGFRAYNGFFTDKGITVIILGNIKEFPAREQLIPCIKQAFKPA